MSKRSRRTTEQLIAELRLFNHHEAAAKLEQLAGNLQNTQAALVDVVDNFVPDPVYPMREQKPGWLG